MSPIAHAPPLSLICSYRWDAAKVQEVLARKREAGALPVNIAAEKTRLRQLLVLAHEGKNDAEIAM